MTEVPQALLGSVGARLDKDGAGASRVGSP